MALVAGELVPNAREPGARGPGRLPTVFAQESQPATDSRPTTRPTASTGVADIGPFRLRLPEGWEPRSPAAGGTGMRKAEVLLPAVKDDQPRAELVVFHFGRREGGSIEANLERWRAQVLPESDAAEPPPVARHKVAGFDVLIVELHGTYDPNPRQPERRVPGALFLAAVVETPQGSYFLRTVGPRASIEPHRKAWIEMVLALEATDSAP